MSRNRNCLKGQKVKPLALFRNLHLCSLIAIILLLQSIRISMGYSVMTSRMSRSGVKVLMDMSINARSRHSMKTLPSSIVQTAKRFSCLSHLSNQKRIHSGIPLLFSWDAFSSFNHDQNASQLCTSFPFQHHTHTHRNHHKDSYSKRSFSSTKLYSTHHAQSLEESSSTPQPSSSQDDEHNSVSNLSPSPFAHSTFTNHPTTKNTQSEFVLKSQPKPGGNWDPENPLGWTQNFGKRNPEKEPDLLASAHLRPGDEGYFDQSEFPYVPNVTVVRSRKDARIVMERLMSPELSFGIFHACDTEVMEIDLKNVGPVGNGYVTCVSVYSGPDFDYGLGDGPGTVLWIDNLDDSFGVLQEFKDFFENENILTVWHNFGFDRHVMWNEGIDVRGFGGDTMHMARLQDTSRGGYSLEALTDDLLDRRKKPMKEIFGVARLRKDGSEGSLMDIPPVEVLQRDPRYRRQWIEYSAFDAEGTWLLRRELQHRLEQMAWFNGYNLWDYYFIHMRKFGMVLTDMERRGMRVDARNYLAHVELQAREDRKGHVETFRRWAYEKIGVDGLAINPASSAQLATFLFGGSAHPKTEALTGMFRRISK